MVRGDTNHGVEEENIVTRQIELPAARKLGEYARGAYHDERVDMVLFPAVSPKSIEEKKKE